MKPKPPHPTTTEQATVTDDSKRIQQENEVQDHEKRVIEEKMELDGKIQRLQAFIRSPTFERSAVPTMQWLLTTQLHNMVAYSAILGERIHLFSP